MVHESFSQEKITSLEFLATEEFAAFDPEVYPVQDVVEKRKSREELIKKYIDVKKLAMVASGLGEQGYKQL